MKVSAILNKRKVTTEAATKLVYCNRCGHETNHRKRGQYEHRKEYNTEEWDGWFRELVILESCCGCDAPSLLIVSETSDSGPEEEISPPRKFSIRDSKRFNKLPDPLRLIYEETVDALNSRSLVLCTLGLRTLLEGVCIDKGIKARNLENKIDGLTTFLPSKNIINSLHGLRFSGNDAAHKMKSLERRELQHALDVMEDLLNYLYELDYKASQLKHAKKQGRIKRRAAASTKAP
jgi:hypothetical protein